MADDLTPEQVAAAQELARETLKADHLAIERHAPLAVPRQVPDEDVTFPADPSPAAPLDWEF